jgi:hypothetical protein
MSDSGTPYDKAIEETAKAASNAIDLVREGGRAIGPTVGNVYGILIGDRVAEARKRRLDDLARKTKKILEDRDIEEQAELPEDIAIPLLEAAQSEPREEMQDRWATLLANAMDPKRRNDVRPEFVYTLSRLTPIDAMILEICKDPTAGIPLSDTEAASTVQIRPTAVRTAFRHLMDMHCGQVPNNAVSIALTDYGVELLHALRR